jgi:hypothetical protein
MEVAVNYDESKVPLYTLPDPLCFDSGSPVSSQQAWRDQRRHEILALFEEHMYGRTPSAPITMRSEVRSETTDTLNGHATRKEFAIHFQGAHAEATLNLLLFLPNTAKQPVPLFLGLNFYGNHTIHSDPDITLANSWVRDSPEYGISQNRATEASRGVQASRWPVEHILARGYGLATAYYGDLDPDYDDGFQNGVHPLFYAQGQTRPAPNEWGAIGAWAWGLQQALDVLSAEPAVDGQHVGVIGHSRLGKAALWAAAQDERFAWVVSNDSGCGGAALSRRCFGETVAHINNRFPHWFCTNFHGYNDHEELLPFDQHMLLALIAPRPLYVASAAEDLWADPKGEFLSAYHAGPVYRLLGAQGLPVDEMPQIEEPVMGTIGYHIRRGGHDITLYDWDRFMDFADRTMK